VIPSYRDRLRAEGAMLAAAGAVAGLLVLALTDDATQNPVSTVVQLAIVAAVMGTLGVLSVRRSIAAAVPLDPADAGTGEPTPLWQHPLIVAGLTLAFGVPPGGDAGLRVGGGCLIVGLAQAVLFERLVAREERRRGVRFHRVKGSSLLRGTRLGTLP
jgi:hypothetical protein